MSLGWQVLAAARARERAVDEADDAQTLVGAMITAAEAARAHKVQLVYIDAVKYLHKGSRIGNAASLLGTVLRIRPVVYVDHQTGIVEVERAARTRTQGIEALVQGFYDRLDLNWPLRVAILHGNVPEKAQELAERIRPEIDPTELLINITGPVLGINTGLAALALCGYSDPASSPP